MAIVHLKYNIKTQTPGGHQMKKSLITIAIALAFTAATTVSAYAFTCEVKSVEGTKVTLDCK